MTSDTLETHLADWLLRKTGRGAVRRVSDLPIGLGSNVGLVRADNQDRAAVLRFSEQHGQQTTLIVVCDGMGGMTDGAVCAATALATFSSSFIQSSFHLSPQVRLLNAAADANHAVYKLFRGSGGATLSALLLRANSTPSWVNIGDSRIYECHDRNLSQVTVDDTLAGQLARDPSSYAGRNELLQFVGTGPMAEPHVGTLENLSDDSMVLITTDGVHFLPANIMQELLVHADDPVIGARRLMDLATWCGGHDNASLALVTPMKVSAKVDHSSRSNFVEVWDAFGDLRLPIIPVEKNHQNLPVTAKDLPLPPPADYSILDAVKNLDKTYPTPRVKRTPKKKSTIKGAEKKDSSDDVPQLMINFRKKGDFE